MKKGIEYLNKIYEAAEVKDDSITKEMKANVLLYLGKHYSKISSIINSRTRNGSEREKYRLRLVKNHLYKIANVYINGISHYVPSIVIAPKNPNELQDKKDAEISNAVYKDIEDRHKLKKIYRKLIKNFIIHGECILKIDYDPNIGSIVGYEEEEVYTKDELGNEVLVRQINKDKPIRSGDFVFEIINGYDMYVDAGASSPEDARFVIIKKLVDKDDIKDFLQKNYEGEELKEKLSYLPNDEDNEIYSMINFATGSTINETDKVLLREFYFRPNEDMPEGKYILATEKGILFENTFPVDRDGEVIFPILWTRLIDIDGTSRGIGLYRQLRPVQTEINRVSSKIAETQILLGDDRLITPYGGAVSEGAKLPGIREIKARGDVKVMPGRTGDQYFQYLQMQVSELYSLAQIPEADINISQSDIMTNLYANLKQKKAFSVYAEIFEDFMKDIADTILRRAKLEYDDSKVIYAAGMREAVNIAEFREVNPMGYSIKVETVSGDSDTLMGKYLQARDLLQYTGGQITPEMIGKVAREGMFFLKEDLFSELVDNVDIIDSIILQLDRGEEPIITKFDDNKKIVDAIVKRMKRPDFKYLVEKNPQVLQVYQSQYEKRTQIIEQQMEELKKANQGLIPTGGAQVKVDISLPDAQGQSKRVSLPLNSIMYLIKRLEEQGAAVADIPDEAQVKIDVSGTV